MERQGSLLDRRDRLTLEDGRTLRLLSALEVLQARREAAELAAGEEELPLCANACLLARAMEHNGRPVYDGGEAVLKALTPTRIGTLAERWARFDREENPAPEDGEELARARKKVWSTRLMSAFAGVCSGRLGPFPRRNGPGT